MPPPRRGGRARRLPRPDRGGWVAFDDTCTHEECSLADGELDGGVVVCPCHASEFDLRTGDVLCAARARPASDLRGRGSRRASSRCGSRRRRAAAEAAHEREDHVPERSPGRRRRAGPVDRRPRARRRRPHRPRRLGGAACRTTGSRCCGARRRSSGSPRQDGRGFWVVHPLRRHRAGLEGLGDVLVRARRDVARGPDAGGGRGAEVDARHRPAAAHAHARARQQGLHAAGRQHVRGADPRPRARDPRAGVRARQRSTGSRTSPPRSRCGSSRRSWACRSRTGGC